MKNMSKIIIYISLIFLTSIYLIYNIALLKNIENFFRTILIISVIVILIVSSYLFIKLKKRKVLTVLTSIYLIIIFFISFNINKVYKGIDKIVQTGKTTSISLVTLSSNTSEDIYGKVGTLKNVTLDKIKNKDLVEKDNYIDLINELYDQTLDYVILPTNYKILFQNMYPNLNDDTKIIYTEEKEIQIEINENKKIQEPFTVLLMGVDSELENIKTSSFNGDALMLLTFNPNTLTTTLLSIPRDSYVPISCFNGNRKNKITHAAWYGEDCMISTIENFLDVDIDYYVEINFKGIVKLVDFLGGIDVDVPLDFCKDDSNRSNNQICLNKGYQTINGEEALALSRYRKTINDIKRGENQQLVLKGLINKIKDINSLDQIYGILDVVSNNMITNMTVSEIFSLYDVVKKIIKDKDVGELSIQRLYINGYDAYIYDYSSLNNQGTKLTLYDYIPYEGSVNEVKEAMKINLGLIEDKKLDTNIVIGKNNTSGTRVSLLPNFVVESKDAVIDYCNSHNIKLNINYITSKDKKIGEVVSQSLPSKMDIEYINELTITVVEKIEEEKINCSLEENKNNKDCIIPNFEGKTYTEFQDWLKKHNYSFQIKINEIMPNNLEYDKNKKGIIIKQKISFENIYDLIGKSIEITYISEK